MSRMHVAAKPSAVSQALARDRLGVPAVLFFVLAAPGVAGLVGKHDPDWLEAAYA